MHGGCESCCLCNDVRAITTRGFTIGKLECSRCKIALVGLDPMVTKVEIRVGAGYRWNMSLCAECRGWLNENIRRSMVVGKDPMPEPDGPRQITL
jgi:hypothetical protein